MKYEYKLQIVRNGKVVLERNIDHYYHLNEEAERQVYSEISATTLDRSIITTVHGELRYRSHYNKITIPQRL